jgi:hypothetical protein
VHISALILTLMPGCRPRRRLKHADMALMLAPLTATRSGHYVHGIGSECAGERPVWGRTSP